MLRRLRSRLRPGILRSSAGRWRFQRMTRRLPSRTSTVWTRANGGELARCIGTVVDVEPVVEGPGDAPRLGVEPALYVLLAVLVDPAGSGAESFEPRRGRRSRASCAASPRGARARPTSLSTVTERYPAVPRPFGRDRGGLRHARRSARERRQPGRLPRPASGWRPHHSGASSSPPSPSQRGSGSSTKSATGSRRRRGSRWEAASATTRGSLISGSLSIAAAALFARARRQLVSSCRRDLYLAGEVLWQNLLNQARAGPPDPVEADGCSSVRLPDRQPECVVADRSAADR